MTGQKTQYLKSTVYGANSIWSHLENLEHLEPTVYGVSGVIWSIWSIWSHLEYLESSGVNVATNLKQISGKRAKVAEPWN